MRIFIKVKNKNKNALNGNLININFSFVVSAERNELNQLLMHEEKSSHIKTNIGEVLNFDYEISKCDEDSRHLQHKIEVYKQKFHERVLQIKVRLVLL